jgi:two-component system, OmpR family, sensor kinase
MAHPQGPLVTSLRATLTIWFIGLLAVVGVLAGAGTLIIALREQNALLDDQLRQIALSVSDSPSAIGESARITSGADPEDEIAVHVLDKNLRTIRNSDPDVAIPTAEPSGFSNHMVGDDEWRTFTLIAETRIIQVSQRTEIRKEAALTAAINTVLPIALLVPLSWLFVGWVLGRVLRPLNVLAQNLKAAQSGKGLKLSGAGIPAEVVPLVSAMNDLLNRQNELIASQQRFVSDAAHQLRTPVTALMLQIGNLRTALPDTGLLAAFGQIETGLARMSQLLNQLLKLARVDVPEAARAAQTANIGDAVRQALADAFPLASAKHIDIGIERDMPAMVRGELFDLTMLIGNLIENAVRYTPEGGKIDIDINGATVVIRDSGPGIPQEVLPRVFERFYRHAAQETEGSGLGLSIVAALAQRYGVSISLENRGNGAGLEAIAEFEPA